MYWIGGSPCAGKSSIAQALAEQYGLYFYHSDGELPRLFAQLPSAQQPVMSRLHQADCPGLWLRPLAQQVREALIYCEEAFAWHWTDLQTLSPGRPILIEGVPCLPHLVCPHLTQIHHAIWLVPTEAFQRHHYAQRSWIHEYLQDCPDPERAFENWMARDARMAVWMAQEARRLGLTVLTVDGGQSLAATAAMVAGHLGLTDSLAVNANPESVAS